MYTLNLLYVCYSLKTKHNINYVIYYLKDYLYYFWLYFYHDFSTQCNYYYSFLFIVIIHSFYGYLLIVHCLLYFFLIYGLIFVLYLELFGRTLCPMVMFNAYSTSHSRLRVLAHPAHAWLLGITNFLFIFCRLI